MKALVTVIVLLLTRSLSLEAYGRANKPIHDPGPTATAAPTPEPTRPPFDPVPFVRLGKDIGPSVDVKFAQEALDHLNKVVKTDCFLKDSLWDFKSTNNVMGVVYGTAREALNAYLAGAPYDLDVRWYYKRFGSVVGYTYNFKVGDSGPSETRIWSNTRMMGSSKDYAAHLAHELSHQARAGGFVHYTVHQGSFPYEIGDLVEKCLNSLQ